MVGTEQYCYDTTGDVLVRSNGTGLSNVYIAEQYDQNVNYDFSRSTIKDICESIGGYDRKNNTNNTYSLGTCEEYFEENKI